MRAGSHARRWCLALAISRLASPVSPDPRLPSSSGRVSGGAAFHVKRGSLRPVASRRIEPGRAGSASTARLPRRGLGRQALPAGQPHMVLRPDRSRPQDAGQPAIGPRQSRDSAGGVRAKQRLRRASAHHRSPELISVRSRAGGPGKVRPVSGSRPYRRGVMFVGRSGSPAAAELSTEVIHRQRPFHVKQRVKARAGLWITVVDWTGCFRRLRGEVPHGLTRVGTAVAGSVRVSVVPDTPPSVPDFTQWPSFPFEGDFRVKQLDDPVAVEPPRRGEGDRECPRARRADDAYIWVGERWRVRAMDRPTGLPMVLILESRSHLDLGDLPNLLAAELGVMTVRLERAIRSLDGVARVHVNRWGDGSAHLHLWFLARPYGRLQLRGTFLSLWDVDPAADLRGAVAGEPGHGRRLAGRVRRPSARRAAAHPVAGAVELRAAGARRDGSRRRPRTRRARIEPRSTAARSAAGRRGRRDGEPARQRDADAARDRDERSGAVSRREASERRRRRWRPAERGSAATAARAAARRDQRAEHPAEVQPGGLHRERQQRGLGHPRRDVDLQHVRLRRPRRRSGRPGTGPAGRARCARRAPPRPPRSATSGSSRAGACQVVRPAV